MNKSTIAFLAMLAAAMVVGGCENPGKTDNEYIEIFDGKTLNGWEGDTVFWRVENGPKPC